MGNLKYSVHSEKTVWVNRGATLAGIEWEFRWIDPSSCIHNFFVLIQGIIPDDFCTDRFAV